MTPVLPLPALGMLGVVNICLGAIGFLAFSAVLGMMTAFLMGYLIHTQEFLPARVIYGLAYDPFAWFMLTLAGVSELLLFISGIGCLRRRRVQGRIVANIYVMVSLIEGAVLLIFADEIRDVLENSVFRIFFLGLPFINAILINSVFRSEFVQD